MHVSSIKPVISKALPPSVANGGSSIPGRVAGLGRAAMIANFCNMMDEWVDLMKKYEGKDKEKDACATTPASPFYTYKRGASGQMEFQKISSADLAPLLALAVA